VDIQSEAPRGRTVIKDNLGSPTDRKFNKALPKRKDYRAKRLRD